MSIQNTSESVVSREQGDINGSDLRKDYVSGLDGDTLKWITEDTDVFLHQALSTPVMNVLTKTDGEYLYDLQGQRYLDLHGNGVHNAGFSNAHVINAVIRQLQEKLAFTPRRYTNIPAIQLAKKLVDISPEGLSRVLFCPGGSEAIEMAVMLAKQVTGRWKTISYWDSYHGNGFQASSIGGEEHFATGNGPMVPGAFHIEFPNYYRNPWGLQDEEAIDEQYIRQLELIIQRNPDIAALVAEPICATPVVPSRYYWERVRAICNQHDIVLIFDEIIEGLGRTGKWFACEHYITPDILVLGKSLGGDLLPFAGIVARESYNVLQHRSIGHYTHEKNPLCATAGLAAVQFIEKEGLVENAAAVGAYLKEQLTMLKARFPVIGHIAGKGLHLGIDLVSNPLTKERAVAYAEWAMYECLKRGVAFKIIEGNILTIRPALTISQSQCDELVNVLAEVFSIRTDIT
ncbi:aspartate aminotransferase family protein [Parapedobacter sp. ISTM3]|uniref:(R)-1-hydroxy-2-aminoethylphosphonate ammonia-lyase n=1 Tax=Parapedobacter sp. ISTM3 TaxID=2800130 RepID=UPI001908D6E6|nr:aspartate aminotransferase family protein [Parapedobacter sp. ISTM3]MBK1438841.1 aspartate aminotransferase family protein [Parapedobacter sp. ISTM3]